MNLTALITEYNPFHNGHIYHLQKSRDITKADGIIVVMSGNFVQRGTPAIFDKWTRTQMALEMGADLVIELPTIYAVSSAEHFAFGAVGIINGLNCVNNIVFGSESNDINSLKKIGQFLYENKIINTHANIKKSESNSNFENMSISNNNHNKKQNFTYSTQQHLSYNSNIEKALKSGISYPTAREIALSKLFMDDCPDISTANDILGIEYIKALLRLNSTINIHTVKRNKAEHHSRNITADVASASAIRDILLSKDNTHPNQTGISSPKQLSHDEYISSLQKIEHTIPEKIHHIYKNASPTTEEALFTHLLYKIWSEKPETLSLIEGISEGLENRIISQSKNCSNYNELIENIKTKRYTRTRIQRALLAILLNIDSAFTQTIYSSPNHMYARILGANTKGRNIIKSLKKSSLIPLITNVNKFVPTSEFMNELLELDFRASDIYSILSEKPNKGIDQRTQPILID